MLLICCTVFEPGFYCGSYPLRDSFCPTALQVPHEPYVAMLLSISTIWFFLPPTILHRGGFPPRHFVVTPTLIRVTSEFPPIQYFTVAPCAYFQYCTVAVIARYTLLQHTPHFLLLTVSLTVEKMQCANHGLSRPHNPLRD